MIPPVLKVRNSGMCIGCGACSVTCPVQKLKVVHDGRSGMFVVAQISSSPCSCSAPLCERVCPSLEVDTSDLTQSFEAKADVWLGPVKRACLSWANDEKLRFNSSSGGTAKALSRFLLETSEVHRVIALCSDASDPFVPKFQSITQPEEISQLSNSFYMHVPFETALRILHEDSNYRFGIVALPCQIQALRKLLSLGTIKADILIIGLFCGGINRTRALKRYLSYHKLEEASVQTVKLRGQGWPGKIVVNDKAIYDRRDPSLLSRTLYWHCFSNDFHLKRCLVCVDRTSELADISLGDAWISRITETDSVGTNVVLLRSERGLKVFGAAVQAGILKSIPVTYREVIDSQSTCLVGHKLGIWAWPSSKTLPSKGFISFRRLSTEWPIEHTPSMRQVIYRRLFWNIARSRIAERFIFPLSIIFPRVIIETGALEIMKHIIGRAEKIWKRRE